MMRNSVLVLFLAGTSSLVAASACDEGRISLGIGPALEADSGAAPDSGSPPIGSGGASAAAGGSSGSAGSSADMDAGTDAASGTDGALDAGNAGDAPDSGALSLVQMRVSGVDDFVYVFVGGVRRGVWSLGDAKDGQIVDVTSWFAGGANAFRLFGMNNGGPAGFRVELWVDGNLVLDESCVTPSCSAEMAGIVYDQTFEITVASGPELQPVDITSATPGALYVGAIGDEVAATGLTTPATLWLPPGQYTFGLGIADDVPFQYTGAYHEQIVEVGAAPVQVDLVSEPPLSLQHTTRIAILPIRQANNCSGPLGDACLDPPDGSNLGVLLDGDVTQLHAQTQAIGDEWLEPFSYGLMSWQVDVLPAVEDTPLRERGPGDWDTSCFIADSEAAQSALEDYDMVVFFFSQHKASGEAVDGAFDVSWSFGGRNVFISTLFTRQTDMTNAFGPAAPNHFLIFLLLGNYEMHNREARRYYSGLEGASGGRSHGFVDQSVNGETGYVAFYRLFTRGQVPERNDMRVGVSPPAVPTEAHLYTGIFETMRRGFVPPVSESAVCVR